ncbi:hypothetical protein CCACVL1_04266, partial [Corchorus capsularis]
MAVGDKFGGVTREREKESGELEITDFGLR